MHAGAYEKRQRFNIIKKPALRIVKRYFPHLKIIRAKKELAC